MVWAVHEIDARANIASSDKVESERVSRRGDTVCGAVLGAVQPAVCCARDRIWARGSVPCVTGVAVGAARRVQPAPVRIEHDGRSLVRAGAALDTFGCGEQGMDLSYQSTNLLAVHGGGEEGGKS